MEYSFEIRIFKREDNTATAEPVIEIKSARWYDRIFRTAVAVIWMMEELKSKVRGKED